MTHTRQPLRIGVDGRAFTSPAGGVRRYVFELYRAIREIAADVEIVAVGATPESRLPEGLSRTGAISFPTNLGWMAASLPLAVRAARVDVFHAPAYTAPLWGVHPQLLTIHDVSYERRPEWNAYRNDRLRRAFYRRGALAADAIVTDSAFSRQEIAAAYPIPPQRISVVPLAPADVFTPGPCDPARLPRGVTRPYVLHVGDIQVRRNLRTALDAILQIRRLPHPVMLVCAGVDRGEGAALLARARDAADPDAVLLTGPVAEDALVNLYRGALLLAYPSRYEGFGLPILEAMRTGIPVVGADAASIPELIGDAGVILPPLDAEAWAAAMLPILTDEGRRQALCARSLARAAEYSWKRTGAATLALLRELAERS